MGDDKPAVRRPFGTTRDGREVLCLALESGSGLRAEVLTRGATLRSLLVPDRRGRPGDVVLGFDDLAGYERSRGYLGCVVGRVANRIRGARFELDGREVRLAPNEGANQLHGGPRGLDRAVFEVRSLEPDRVRLATTSPHGDQGYPGRLELEVAYVLEDDALRLEFVARSDRPTPVNPSHHAYWNLSGRPGADVRDHLLSTPATHRLEVDAEKLPTGRVLPVDGTRFDLREPTPLGPLLDAGGFDDPLVLPGASGLHVAATLHHPGSGRTLELSTTQPGFQLYTGNHLDEPRGKGGVRYAAHAGLCLEPQHPPDAVNQPGFPSIVLRPGRDYRQTHRFRLFSS
ncbi:MAG: aldose epimerase family protein [Myxococcota bacterium]